MPVLAIIVMGIFLFLGEDRLIAQSPHHFKIEYTITLEAGDNLNQEIQLWLPYPRESQNQKVIDYQVKGGWKPELTQGKKYGNQFLYFKNKLTQKSTPLTIVYQIKRYPDKGGKQPNNSDNKSQTYLAPKRFLEPNNMVPNSPLFQIMAQNAVAKKPPAKHIRTLYDYTIDLMNYDKSGKGWGHGDAIWACDAKRGNCTDFHSLYIGMARSLKVPARFEIGFSLPLDKPKSNLKGYHCWAQAYDSQKGWIPLDASEAKKAEVKGTQSRDYFYGTLPPDRVQFSVGRDIILNPPQKGAPLNYFIYPYAEVEGKPYQSFKKSFSYTRIAPSLKK